MAAIKGTVARLLPEKGFGFILAVESDVEYFFHKSAVDGARFEQLHQGQAVTFDEGDGTKGPRAERVRVIG